MSGLNDNIKVLVAKTLIIYSMLN